MSDGLVKNTTPPNWDTIVEAFGVTARRPVLYAYAPHVYNPSGIRVIPNPLIMHEMVHIERQGEAPDEWWQYYIDDAGFRLAEEILGHRAEYVEVCKHPNTNRHQRRAYLDSIAKRLASPLYGNLVKAKTIKSLLPAMDDPAVLMKVLQNALRTGGAAA